MSIDDLLTAPPRGTEYFYELLEYQRFLDASRTSPGEAYLFFESRVRFTAEPDDVLAIVTPSAISSVGGQTVFLHEASRSSIALPTLDVATARRILENVTPGRPLIGVQFAAGCNAAQMDAFVRATLGRVLFVPHTLERFEARLSGTELVRFVGSPYEVQRNYWSNMADCRDRIVEHLTRPMDLAAWLDSVKALHVVLLIGADGRSFYRPQSPLGQRDARPGALYLTPSRRLEESGKTWFIDGPRVNAPFVGGRTYHELLCRSLDDAGALLPTREVLEDDGVGWGGVWFGQARHDAEAAPWFCPPRPITPLHLRQLHAAFERGSAHESSLDARLDAMADFHWRFVRLHPFRCANQSLAMNVVNALRIRAALPPIPHLLLDQLALRLTRAAYRRVFARASKYWGPPECTSLERWRKLAEYRVLLDRFVNQLSETDADTKFSGARPDDARGAQLALLTD